MAVKIVQKAPRRLLRIAAVADKTGLSKSTLHERVAEGRFPKPVRLGGVGKAAAVAWVESEVDAWIDQQIAKRDNESA